MAYLVKGFKGADSCFCMSAIVFKEQLLEEQLEIII